MDPAHASADRGLPADPSGTAAPPAVIGADTLPPLSEAVASEDESRLDALAGELVRRGWSAWPGFLAADEAAGLRREIGRLQRGGAFRAAGVGRGPSFALRPEVRCDRVCWIDPGAPTRRQRRFLARMEALRAGLNARLQLGLFGYEAHLTVYPPGAFYRRHVDVFAEAAHRVVSTCTYLDAGWSPADGGALRLQGTGGELADVLPEAGQLVVFLADRIPHEVLPTARERASITGWFTRRP